MALILNWYRIDREIDKRGKNIDERGENINKMEKILDELGLGICWIEIGEDRIETIREK